MRPVDVRIRTSILGAQSRARTLATETRSALHVFSALEEIYASSDLKKAPSAWRYALTQIWEALSYPDADESETEDTRETQFGAVVNGQADGWGHLEQKLRAEVIDVVAMELGQRR